ncbi:uncharacterized protein [Macrobrachium rosenbergii]|uniref:uncharacterized protein n=1 Tax=Macrobrachium rosenbergii TaxID=79674 RepID=UPI0034D49C0F
MLRLVAAVLATSLLFFRSLTAAEADVATTIGLGIDDISATLSYHEDRCSDAPVEGSLKDKLQRSETVLERQASSITVMKNNTEVLLNKTEEALERYYRTANKEVPDVCGEPFQRSAGSCFWAHKGPSLSWGDAREFCQQEGGDLATPEDTLRVVEFLSEELGSGWWYVWFGGKQNAREEWKWLESDASMDAGDSLWESVEETEVDPERKRCAAFRSDSGYKISKQDCGDTNWFICEKKI